MAIQTSQFGFVLFLAFANPLRLTIPSAGITSVSLTHSQSLLYAFNLAVQNSEIFHINKQMFSKYF